MGCSILNDTVSKLPYKSLGNQLPTSQNVNELLWKGCCELKNALGECNHACGPMIVSLDAFLQPD